MRLINLPSQDPRVAPLVLMALGDLKEDDVCHHYRTTRDHVTSMSVDGLDLVLASEKAMDEGQLDGLTLDSLLAICEDRAKHQGHADASMRLVAMNLLAARRALAAENSGMLFQPSRTGDVTNPAFIGTATPIRKVQGD